MKLRSGTMIDTKDIKLGVDDTSYNKLSMYDGSSSVKIWLDSADSCIAIKGLKEDAAASYILYHLAGQARIEVLMLGEDLTKVDQIRKALLDRFEFENSINEIIYRIMARKQSSEEGVMEYLDAMLGLGLELKQQEEKWEGVVVESIRKNLISNELRRSLINKNALSFKEIRDHIREWNIVGDDSNDVNCYRINSDMYRGNSDMYRGNSDMYRGNSDMSRGNSDMYRGNSDMYRGNSDMYRGNSDMSRGNSDMYRGNGDMSRGNSDMSRGNGGIYRGNSDMSTGNGEMYRGNSDMSRGNGGMSRGNGGMYRGNGVMYRGNNERGTYRENSAISRGGYMGYRGRPIQCYRCGMHGHLANVCRNFYNFPN